MLSTSKLFYNPSTGGATDPYFKYVPLLLETTTTNGQQNNTFLDSSTNNFTITRNGTPTQGSVTPYWPNGYWSNYFGGAERLSIASNATLALGTGDFTIEMWVYNQSTTSRILTWPTVGAPIIYFNTSNFLLYDNYGVGNVLTSSIAVPLNTWAHIAICRASAVTKIFINGVQGASGSDTNNWGQNGINIGADISSTFYTGYLSNLRIVKGTALYTSAFTPPTTPLTAVTNTLLLTCQSNRFRDNSTNNFTITTVGTPRVQAFQPFSPAASYTPAAYGGSGYFNGSSDYLTVADNAAFQPGSGDFTFEAWVYPFSLPGASAYKNIWSQRTTSSLYGGASASIDSAGALVYFIANSAGNNWQSGGASSGLTVTLNSWQHIALVRSGNTVTIYRNGIAGTPITIAAGLVAYFGNLALMAGAADGSQKTDGYISNFRMVKGTAVYTGAFTPPTLAPLTAAGSTSAASYSSTTNVNTSFSSSITGLLTNFTNAGIYDAAVQNNAITVGSAQASISQYQWSPTSIRLNGTTDYLTMPNNPALALGSASFTIELWFYKTSTADGSVMDYASAGGFGFVIQNNNIQTFSTVGAQINFAGTININQWNYLALVRSGGTLSCYLNGSSIGTPTADSKVYTSPSTLFIGRNAGGAVQYFPGYIQDLRITKGVARTITTPTAAFPTR